MVNTLFTILYFNSWPGCGLNIFLTPNNLILNFYNFLFCRRGNFIDSFLIKFNNRYVDVKLIGWCGSAIYKMGVYSNVKLLDISVMFIKVVGDCHNYYVLHTL